ncbi:hypothetical protein EV175_006496, partial [Coemansia sp. RSA 1933]
MSRPQPSQRQQTKETTAPAGSASARSRQRLYAREQLSGATPESRDSLENSENDNDGPEESPDDDLDDNQAGMTNTKSRQRHQKRDSTGEQDASEQHAKPGGGRN